MTFNDIPEHFYYCRSCFAQWTTANDLCPFCGSLEIQELADDRDMQDYAPPDDDDPHGITARNKWADEEYGLDDGTG